MILDFKWEMVKYIASNDAFATYFSISLKIPLLS